MLRSWFRSFSFYVLLAPIAVHALQQVTRSGRYLYTADGNRFYIKGVAYQQEGIIGANNEPTTFSDPLSDSDGCSRDIPNFQKLGINAIRVYSVESSLNHDSCMSALDSAGIYTIIDLSLPVNGSIDTDSPSWTTNLLNEYTATIDAFAKYDNVLAYNVGNEVVFNISSQQDVAPYVKAAARDIKAYLASKSSSILVGYASIDSDAASKIALADYLSCDPSSSNSGSTSVDIYGLNNYEWCDNTDTFQSSGYSTTESDFANYNVVAYFSEFGCVPPQGVRQWGEVTELFSSDMTSVWSGGLAFSYFNNTDINGNPTALVSLSSDNSTATPNQDFTNLASAYSSASPTNSPTSSSAPSATYPSCPGSTTFPAATALPPTPNNAACSCLQNALSCRFTPSDASNSSIAGTVIDSACQLLGGIGGSCNDIGGNGTTGVYGLVADCDPNTVASYVMSEWYESNQRQESACSFGGSGVVNSAASASATAAASSCITSPSATFVPSGISATAASSSTGTSGSSSSGGSKSNGDISQLLPSRALLSGLSAVFATVLASAVCVFI